MASQEFDELQFYVRQVWKQYGRPILAAVAAVIVAASLFTTIYKIEADSRGVVLRLGEYHATTNPGLHYKLPFFIDRVYKVPVEKVQALEFGYQTLAAGRRTQFAPTNEERKTVARMLTGDLNLAHVEWVVQYQIKDAKNHLFKIGGEGAGGPADYARDLIRDVSETVMRRVIGDVSVDSIITTGRQEIAGNAKTEIQEILDEFEAGVRIVAVKLQSATPPDPVKDAFDAVNRAKQSKERVVNDAKGQRNKLVPAARGRRDRTIAEAEGYRIRVQKEAEGLANAFLAKLAEYEKAPEITKIRLYIEAMEDVLAQVDEKIIIDESVKGMMPLLHLGDGGQRLTGSVGPGRSTKGGAR